jgi:acetoin utilization protein AcuB
MKRSKVRVRDRMTAEPPTVGPQDSLNRAAELLRRREIRAVPVVEEGKLIGIVTDRDIRQVAPIYPLLRDEEEIRRYTDTLKVTAAMTANPLRVSPDASLVQAAKLIETYGFSSLPVVDEDALVGMISVTELLKAFIEQIEDAEEAVP